MRCLIRMIQINEQNNITWRDSHMTVTGKLNKQTMAEQNWLHFLQCQFWFSGGFCLEIFTADIINCQNTTLQWSFATIRPLFVRIVTSHIRTNGRVMPTTSAAVCPYNHSVFYQQSIFSGQNNVDYKKRDKYFWKRVSISTEWTVVSVRPTV